MLDAFKIKNHHQFNNHKPVVIPGGSPSKLQILHVVLNKSFKNHLSSCEVGGSQWEYALIPAGRIKNHSITFLFK